jgi:hypothetical protein
MEPNSHRKRSAAPKTPGTNHREPVASIRAPRNRGASRSSFHFSPFTFQLSSLTRHLSLLTSAILLLAATTPASADDNIPPKLPLQDFFRNPQAAGYTLSDDGKFLAFLAPWQDRLNVWVQSVAGGDAKRLTNVTDRDLADVAWKGNDTVLFVSQGI